MTAQRIFELEKRDGNNLYDIHFYLEGIFWKSYGMECLFESHIFHQIYKIAKKLKILKKQTKYNDNGFIQVGLQLSSFEKYFPNAVDDEEIFELDRKTHYYSF